MAITLYEVWRLALPPTTLLYGEDSLKRPVRTALLLKSIQPALPELHGGEVVLLTPALLEALNPHLTLYRLLERLHGSSIVAIATTGSVDQAVIRVAHQAALAVFKLPDTTDIRAVQREIQRLLTDHEAQYERRAAQLYAALTRQPLTLSVSDITAMLAQWTGAQVMFPAEPGMALNVPVRLVDQAMGMLGSTQTYAWDRLALEQGAAALALLLGREQAIEDRVRGTVVDALLTGMPLDAPGLIRAQEQGLSVDHAYVLLALQPVESTVALERIQAAIKRIVEQRDWQGLIMVYDDSVLVALPITADQAAERQVQTIHASVSSMGFEINGGFAVAETLSDWMQAWQEARQSLTLGHALLGSGYLAGAAELGVYRLLLSVYDREVAISLYQQTIAPLAAYDQRQAGELVHTLATFFIHLGNHSQAAAALHIHRNTLLYRLGRISALTGHHLDRFADRLALQVGLALHQIYQSQQLSHL